ncbi:MAG TPA: response regulator transcription factor [Aggregatilineales bacterium]|nr:response regulator transcription factor [Anaerolineales bacterium]HRE46704.1 response regulator transcription factor [Aggregatilineales bacterium]
MAQRILVVEDEPGVSNLLAYNLRKAHYEVELAVDGRQALAMVRSAMPDLIVLDLMLPEMDGLEVCREIRRTSHVPIIILTAQGEEIDRVVGLELGADDYVCKPFSVRELLARIKAVLRRLPDLPQASSQPPAAVSVQGTLRLDAERREVFLGDTLLDLSKLEFDLLHWLLMHPGRVFTREELLEQIWGYAYTGDTRTVDSSIKRLRSKLRAADPRVDYLVAVRGIGYKFSQEDGA